MTKTKKQNSFKNVEGKNMEFKNKLSLFVTFCVYHDGESLISKSLYN